MEETKYCIKCGKQIPIEAEFCNFCGAKQATTSNEQEPSSSIKTNPKESDSRNWEKVLAIVGGICSILTAFVFLAFVSLYPTTSTESTGAGVMFFGLVIIGFLEILLPFFAENHQKKTGVILIILSFGNLIFGIGYGILSFILVLISGILTLKNLSNKLEE
ncbi:zinc-ribbon domain-containing protein [Pediococcus claussenii]|uniref:zinc-ribbon domain-containing protein n=1 Tax=Pediococcus claussenii TaxID=187452 RepID=UPI00081A4E59|nr:zinc ribbon domain-containing protein [Pediococcus claussenii]ANZ70337.1 hypothetical protein AYR57_08425 [Pediococcus claussenii]ANZ72153.1 hypothetical protein AYR58_08425 [Pediococcus claussenii]